MAADSPAILSYASFNRRRRRLIVVTSLLTLVACPLFYRRHELSRWTQIHYQRLAFHRAERRAMRLQVDPGLLARDEPTNASPIDRTWVLAWQRMTTEFEQVIGLSSPPSAASPAVVVGYSDAGYTPLLIAPMTGPTGVRADVVVLAKDRALVTEVWTP